MDNTDLVEEGIRILRLPSSKPSAVPSGVEKLQEFCCLAAKCGFRWAWSDTCCINKKDYAETSESINYMFLWYHGSDLTIVYLDDVEDVEDGRFSVMDEEDGNCWFEDAEMRKPLPPSDPSALQSSSGTYAYTFLTEPYLSLHNRLRDRTSPQLRSMQPDTQVEGPYLDAHLNDNFPNVEDCKIKGKYRKLPVWVTRGWTLQDMIASKRLRFYSKNWTLLEEFIDSDTDEAEKMISISSFRHRARLVDHRASAIWCNALVNTTGVPARDLTKFEPGAKNVRARLQWAARRRTEKVEDMAYCLLGIFDVTLPVMYGEGPRAFFRLQEELLKHTGDTSLFDWCGRSSSVNSFLAYSPECFIEHNLSSPSFDDPTDSTFSTTRNLFSAIFGTVWTGFKGAVSQIKHIMKSTPPSHCLVNGELTLSLFEHQVRRCERLKSSIPGDPYYHYKLKVDGLTPTTVTLASQASSLMDRPTQYYLCRVWDRHTRNVFQIFLELIEYLLKDSWKGIFRSNDREVVVDDEAVDPESKLREEMQMKRMQVLEFFKYPFPVFLICVEDGRRVRVSTVNRVIADYAKFDFTMPVVTRLFR
ncbi:hypothetical protein OG21DRAFT_1506533 [Imleria badia]|nr:hypothetical protein OG21DRAFT_1506533 [Imleria badia]